MGDFHPDAHVKGLATSNLIALICSRNSATLSADSSFNFMTQMYKVFINNKCIFLANNADDFSGRNGKVYNYSTESEFNSIIKAEMDKRLLEALNKDLNMIVIDEEYQKQDIINQMKAGQGGIQKTMRFSKTNLQDVEAGQVLDLGGVKYKVQDGANTAEWILSLVDETMAV